MVSAGSIQKLSYNKSYYIKIPFPNVSFGPDFEFKPLTSTYTDKNGVSVTISMDAKYGKIKCITEDNVVFYATTTSWCDQPVLSWD